MPIISLFVNVFIFALNMIIQHLFWYRFMTILFYKDLWLSCFTKLFRNNISLQQYLQCWFYTSCGFKNIWSRHPCLSSYDHLTPTDVGGQRGSCQLSQRKGACFLLNKKEALSGLIQVNDDKDRSGGQAGRVCGCQL